MFTDTCVEDDDCEDFPNTVCRNSPVNSGLDPGTRELPFTGLVLIRFLSFNVFLVKKFKISVLSIHGVNK